MIALDSRRAVRRTLKAHPPVALANIPPPMPPESFAKAGILPFLPGETMENWRFLMMQPVATRPDRGPPQFQMAKGTRMHRTLWSWIDMEIAAHVGKKETLAETALREGQEELGLDVSRIARLFDAGAVCFTSVKTGEAKWMWLFAAEMQNLDCLLPDVAPTTAQRRWMTLAECKAKGRADHLPIIERTATLLAPYYEGYVRE